MPILELVKYTHAFPDLLLTQSLLVLQVSTGVDATDCVEAVEPLYLVSMQQYCPVPHAALLAELPGFVPAGHVLDV